MKKTYPELITEFKFNQHKAFGTSYLSEDQLAILAAVYGLREADARNVADACAVANAENAEKLRAKYPPETLSAAAPARIGFLGDSITAYRESYANIIRSYFSSCPRVKVFDYAVSGARSGDLLANLYPFIWERDPDIVHMMIGTNDCRRINDVSRTLHTLPDEFGKNLSYIISAFRNAGKTVIVSSIPPFSMDRLSKTLPQYRLLYTEEDRQFYNGILKDLCRKHGAVFNNMDPVYADYTSDALTLDDGLHLNELGHTLLADRVLYHINTAIKERE